MSKIKMPDKGKRVRASKLERRDYKWIYLFLLPSVVMFLMFYFVPILTMFFTSFTKWDGFNCPCIQRPRQLYQALFKPGIRYLCAQLDRLVADWNFPARGIRRIGGPLSCTINPEAGNSPVRCL